MKLSFHPQRQTAFQRLVLNLDLLHGTIQPGKPWQNGLIERSHRTDNDELFHRERFASSEERRYRLRLWEYQYATRWPHQALGGRTPMQVYLSEYRCHAPCRMLT
jgi:transposase InsO family protein